MAWITPKTNWSAGTGASPYNGDYFNAVDYNRIRENLLYLTGIAEQLYSGLIFTDTIGGQKTYSSWIYADEINAFENRLDEINTQTINVDIGEKKTYVDNGKGLDATELNRLESACVTLYDILHGMAGGRRMLQFTLGLPASAVRG